MPTNFRPARVLLAALLAMTLLQTGFAQAASSVPATPSTAAATPAAPAAPEAVGRYTGTLTITATKTRTSSQYKVANEKVTLTIPLDLTLTRTPQADRDTVTTTARTKWVLDSDVRNTADMPPPPPPDGYGYNYTCTPTTLSIPGSFDLKVTAWRINAADGQPDKVRISAHQGYAPPPFDLTSVRTPSKSCGMFNSPGAFIWDAVTKCTYDGGCLASTAGETKTFAGEAFDGVRYSGSITLNADQTCSVPPLSNPPWQDPDSQWLEDGKAAIWNKGARIQELIQARDKVLERIRRRGWQAAEPESAYRSEEYQQHFIEIVDKLAALQELEKAKDPRQIFACTALKFNLLAEKARHGLGTDVAKPASASDHVQGAAFDMTVKDESGYDMNGFYYGGGAIPLDTKLAEVAGPELILPLPQTDSVHFALPPPCPVPLPRPLNNLDSQSRAPTGEVLWPSIFQDPDSRRLEAGEVIWDKGARIQELQRAKDALLSRLPKTWKYNITAAYMTAEYRQHLLDVSGALKKMLDLTARSDIRGCSWYRVQLEQHWMADQPADVPPADSVGAQHVAGAAFTIAVWNEGGHLVTGEALKGLAGPGLVVATPGDVNIRLQLPPLPGASQEAPTPVPAPTEPAVPPPAPAAKPVKVTDMFVKVKGAPVDAEVVILNGRSLLPLRLLATLLGATVDWSAELAQATISKGNKTVKLRPNATTAELTVDGKATTMALEVPVTLVDDRIRVPLKFMGSILDVQVGWDGATRTISIDD